MTMPYISKTETIDWQSRPACEPAVTKIVLGKLLKTDDESIGGLLLPEDNAERFPNLELLHIWGLRDVVRLPVLPSGLKELDIRDCPNLRELPELPEGLEVLTISGAKALETLPESFAGSALWELTLTDCSLLGEAAIHRLLKTASSLKKLDLSGCRELKTLSAWPPHLQRIELNRCDHLIQLPEEDELEDDPPGMSWPIGLRRLGLRGASAIKHVPSLPECCVYVDFAHAEALEVLPIKWADPSALFLYGSGIQVPPASEHGVNDEDDVASGVAEFFSDIRLTGQGRVRRCRILVLGNGEVGKTCLSLRLTGRDPNKAVELGSTHGVQFWSWELELNDSRQRQVDTQVWDFGGQEIYHNTHRLFVSRGSLFVVVWNPDREGKIATSEVDGYRDEWRPLQYWFDYIAQQCEPARPRIALVCAGQSVRTEALEAQWRAQLKAEDQERVGCCHYIDSIEGSGDFGHLKKWLTGSASALIRSEGTAVPSYWDLAQSMVQEWLEGEASESQQVSFEAFRDALWSRLVQESADKQRYRRLAQTMDREGEAFLTNHRIERTLAFLTRIGWVYWNRDLFEARVIIGQQWALDGVYALLDRRRTVKNDRGEEILNLVYPSLIERQGRFQREDLIKWYQLEQGEREGPDWARYSVKEQRLILSYMERVNLCFRIIPTERGHWRYREEPLYVSVEHLPEDDRHLFDLLKEGAGSAEVCRELYSEALHKGDWQALLKEFGQIFGKDGEYAKHAVYAENDENQRILIRYQGDRDEDDRLKGLGGKIRIFVRGTHAESRLSEVVGVVMKCIPRLSTDLEGEGRGEGLEHPGFGEEQDEFTVFVSYAWNPNHVQEGLIDGEVPHTYERPVDQLEEALAGFPRIRLIRDKMEISGGADIARFMRESVEADFTVMVHSDKYWMSAYCMYEFHESLVRLLNQPQSMIHSIRMLQLPSSKVFDSGGNCREKYNTIWQCREDTDGPPLLIINGYSMARLKNIAGYVFRELLPRSAAIAGLRVRLKDDDKALRKQIKLLAREIDEKRSQAWKVQKR